MAGDCSIADMAVYPWIVPFERQGMGLEDFPNLKRWFEAIAERPAVRSAYDKGRKLNEAATVTDESKAILFGQRRRRRA